MRQRRDADLWEKVERLAREWCGTGPEDASARRRLNTAIYSPDMLVGRFHYRIDTLLPIDFTGKKGH